MNQELTIVEAKSVIKDKVISYLETNEVGQYTIPIMNQNPIFLKSRPGIGKTTVIKEIVNELAEEEGIKLNLLAYDISHMLMSNMVGLPTVRQTDVTLRGGETETAEMTINTVPDIVRSVHKVIKKTGVSQGILFLDEINCCSESLFRILLTLLQSKKIANYDIPDGWVIICAGNDNTDNSSAREFDGAILDRLFCIEIIPDYQSWRTYAVNENIHPDIIAFLDSAEHNSEIKGTFYNVGVFNSNQVAVTPRSWVDLSMNLKSAVYRRGIERRKSPQDRRDFAKSFVYGNLCHPEIAGKFLDFHINSLDFAMDIDDDVLCYNPEDNREKIKDSRRVEERTAELEKIKQCYQKVFDICGEKSDPANELSFFMSVSQHLADYENSLASKYLFYKECLGELNKTLYSPCSPLKSDPSKPSSENLKKNGKFVFSAPLKEEVVSRIDSLMSEKEDFLKVNANTMTHDKEYRARFMLKFLERLKNSLDCKKLTDDSKLMKALGEKTLQQLDDLVNPEDKYCEIVYLSVYTEFYLKFREFMGKARNYDANVGGLLEEVFSRKELYKNSHQLMTMKSLIESKYSSTLASNRNTLLANQLLKLRTFYEICKNNVMGDDMNDLSEMISLTEEFG